MTLSLPASDLNILDHAPRRSAPANRRRRQSRSRARSARYASGQSQADRRTRGGGRDLGCAAGDRRRTGGSCASHRPKCRQSGGGHASVAIRPRSRRAAGRCFRPRRRAPSSRGRTGGGASAGTSRRPERFRSCTSLTAASAPSRPPAARKRKVFQERRWREATQCHVLRRGAYERIGVGRGGKRLHLRPGFLQPRPSDRLLDGFDRVDAVFLRALWSGRRAWRRTGA